MKIFSKFEFQGLVKADAEKRQLVGTIYRSDKIDTQGEFMTGAELEKAAHAALANGIKIDVGHNGQALDKSHAALVESSVVDDGGGKLWKGVVQLSQAAWDQLVKSNKVAAFSIGGRAPRRVVRKDGRDVREIFDAAVEFVSLVKAGSIGEPVVAKSDVPAWAQTLFAQNEALAVEIAAIKDSRLGKSSSGSIADVRKVALTEHAAKNEAKLADLQALHLSKSRALQAIWEGATPAGEGRVNAEQRLCRDLAAIEEEMSALGKSSAVDLGDPARSAFHFRGGTSTTMNATLPSDNAYSRTNNLTLRAGKLIERPNKLTKAEDEIDLNSLKV